MSEYQPEIGQALFGQPHQTYEASLMMEAAIDRIAREWRRCIGNTTGHISKSQGSPFDNTGATFSTEGLDINAYSWSDDDEQTWNLKCGDIEVSWYKHSSRGLSVNKDMSNDDIAAFLDEVLNQLKPCDYPLSNGELEHSKDFTYNGTLYRAHRYKDFIA